VDRQESTAALSLREPFQLIISHGRVSGVTELPYQGDSLTYRARLPNHSPVVEVVGQHRSLVLTVTIPPHEKGNLFFRGGIPITTVDFTRQHARGDPETTLLKDGEIAYPEYPKVPNVPFRASEFIAFSQLDRFSIEEMTLEPSSLSIRLRLNGLVGQVRTGSKAFSVDHRLTRFDTLLQNPRLMVLFSIVIWVLPTTLGGYRLYREMRG
jgi:hypothetical protein